MNKRLKRREFCRALSGAALGGLSLPLLAEKALGKKAVAKETGQASKERLITREEMMEKKIKAVEAKVISVKETCGLGHKVGDVITFTEHGVEGKICIHALYSMLPAVFAMMFEARFPWLSDPDKKTHPCTDAANPVVFEIFRVREA
jgi:uncharacterized repeat protein (TIGR04076 family)